MKTIAIVIVVIVYLLGCVIAAASPLASGAITYQGLLRESGLPAAGPVDLRFTLYDAATNGNSVGSSVEQLSVDLDEGHFAVDLDFGPDVFEGSDRWIEIEVAPLGSGAWVILDPRQKVMPAPVALFALNGNEGPPGSDALWEISGSNMYYTGGRIGIGTRPVPFLNLIVSSC